MPSKKTALPFRTIQPPSSADPSLIATLKQAGITNATPAFDVDGKPVYLLHADGNDAITLWKKLRKLTPKTGHWPIILETGAVPQPGDMQESPERAAGWLKKQTGKVYDPKLGLTAMILKAADDLDLEQWLSKNAGTLPTAEDDEWAEFAEAEGVKLPKTKPNNSFSSVVDILTRKPLKNIPIALYPAQSGPEAAALMCYGGWNECPYPHVQVAMLRRWQEKYAAELTVAARATVELSVGKPPKTDAAALALAKEQFAYCDDIVHQGTMTLERLAATLKNATVWYFWWD